MIAYLNATDDVVASSERDHAVADVQALITAREGTDPGVLTKVAGAPDDLVGVYTSRDRGLPAYFDRRLPSTAGTDAAHYQQVEFLDPRKRFRCGGIYERTLALIDRGALINGRVYGRTPFEREEIRDIYTYGVLGATAAVFPVFVTPSDRAVRTRFTDAAAFLIFYNAFESQFSHWLSTGQDLEQQIRDAATLAAVDAVADNRTWPAP